MIANRQRLVRVPIRDLQRFFARAMSEVRLPSDAASVCLVTNGQIAKWNAAYRGKPKPTDVLSFPVKGAPREGAAPGRKRKPARAPSSRTGGFADSAYLGDIAIAPAVARQNARLYRRSLSQEIRILILHGILHLMGYDHETDSGQMERRERRLRRALGIA
jgi:probable rRNA maturation factor